MSNTNISFILVLDLFFRCIDPSNKLQAMIELPGLGFTRKTRMLVLGLNVMRFDLLKVLQRLKATGALL